MSERTHEMAPVPEAPGEYLSAVRAYYDAFYVPEVLPMRTHQVARVHREGMSEGTATTLFQAGRAGVGGDERILDAGCGVGGPAIDLARHYPGITIDAVTLAPRQAACARMAVVDAGLGERIRVHEGDYHALPFPDATFDLVCFFESFCYSYDPAILAQEALRLLRPGGRLYVKDIFRRPEPLTPQAREELELHDRIFVVRLRTLEESREAARDAGFHEVEASDLEALPGAPYGTVRETLRRSGIGLSVRLERGIPVLTPFGRRHHVRWRELPVLFGDLRAVRPG